MNSDKSVEVMDNRSIWQQDNNNNNVINRGSYCNIPSKLEVGIRTFCSSGDQV